jgi:hypothetical protein
LQVRSPRSKTTPPPPLEAAGERGVVVTPRSFPCCHGTDRGPFSTRPEGFRPRDS